MPRAYSKSEASQDPGLHAKLALLAFFKVENNMTGLLWPFSLPYRSSELADFVVAPSADASAFASAKVIVARDGLLPLLWFFHQNPDPQKFGRRLLVHEDLAEFVPPSWRSDVGTYRLIARQPPATPERIFFYGLVAQEHASVDRLSKTLQETRRVLGEDRWQKLPKFLCVTTRVISFARGYESFQTEFLMQLGRLFGPEIQICTWHDILMRESFDGCLAVSLNDRMLCADNSVEHIVLGRRGLTLEQMSKPAVSPNENKILLSPHHAWSVRENQLVEYRDISLEQRDYFERFGRYFAKERSTDKHTDLAPWPAGWAAWLKSQKDLHV